MSVVISPKKAIEPDLPRKPPMKNTSHFEEPKNKCEIKYCPNLATGCGLCNIHCRKIHKSHMISNKNLKKLKEDYENTMKK